LLLLVTHIVTPLPLAVATNTCSVRSYHGRPSSIPL
jgi:hypothetical protein